MVLNVSNCKSLFAIISIYSFPYPILIDIIIKTYNSSSFRTNLLFKSDFGISIDNSKYYPKEIYSEIEEDEYTTEILLAK